MITTLEQFLIENVNKSQFLSKNEKYGSYEGIIHSDIEKIKNWFINRGIYYTKYIYNIEIPVAFLNNINVGLRYRRKGYGYELYSDFEQECNDNSAKCIILESDSGESQKKGFNLECWYESLDFGVIGNEGSNFIMIKTLD